MNLISEKLKNCEISNEKLSKEVRQLINLIYF